MTHGRRQRAGLVHGAERGAERSPKLSCKWIIDYLWSWLEQRGPASGGEMAVTSAGEEVLGRFHGSEDFPIEWDVG